MDTHKNARLTPKGREQMVRDVVDGGLTKAAAARPHKVSWKTVNKWVERFRTEGVSGLIDRAEITVVEVSPGRYLPAPRPHVAGRSNDRHGCLAGRSQQLHHLLNRLCNVDSLTHVRVRTDEKQRTPALARASDGGYVVGVDENGVAAVIGQVQPHCQILQSISEVSSGV